MYKYFIRPILFLFPPERAHHLTAFFLRAAQNIPGGKLILSLFSYRRKELRKEVFGISFSNPIGVAAGLDKNAEFYDSMGAMGFGFVEVGTVTPRAQPGNPAPRLFRLPKDCALINRMGFNNLGSGEMLERLKKRKGKTVVGINLGKNTDTPLNRAAEDYLYSFRLLYEFGDYFVINVSCPNVKDVTSLQNREFLMPILEALFTFRQGQDRYKPVLLKVSPDIDENHLDQIVEILKETPLDGLVAVNTTTSRQGLSTRPAKLGMIGPGGLSGAPLTERAIETVRYLSLKTEGKYPIIGLGGVMTPRDAEAMLDAGASLVQVYTGFIYNGPGFVRKICRHLSAKANR